MNKRQKIKRLDNEGAFKYNLKSPLKKTTVPQ